MKKFDPSDNLADAFKQLFDKEAIRNNGKNTTCLHEYSSLCSCGRCSASGIVADYIRKCMPEKANSSGTQDMGVVHACYGHNDAIKKWERNMERGQNGPIWSRKDVARS